MKPNLVPCFLVATTLLPVPSAFAGAPTESDVTFPSGEVRLAAALLMPEGEGPFAAAVILQGSGDSDRTNLWARSWAETLAAQGVVALLTDKRGCGRSAGDWRTVGYGVLAEDALAAVDFLAGLPQVEAGSIGLVGLSQGGSVAPLAGSRSEKVAFVVSVSSSATTAVDQVDHEMRNTFRQAGLDESSVEEGMRLQALAEQYVRTGDWASYSAALERALASSLAPVAAGFPQDRDSWVWEFWRQVGDFDPLESWERLRVPGLVLYGEEDERDNVPVAASVRRLAGLGEGRDLTVRVFPGSGHALFDPEQRGRRVLRPDATRLLIEWIRARTATSAPPAS
jgi:hypothetical protein